MKKFLAIAAIALLAATFFLGKRNSKEEMQLQIQADWKQWLVDFAPNLSAEEMLFRYKIFVANWWKIYRNNKNPESEVTLGLTQFAIFTQEEFEQQFLIQMEQPEAYEVVPNTENGNTDWRTQGAVQRVKNQGQCGSCWAFSAVGALESLSKVSGGSLLDLSEQQLVDCSRSYGNQGCNGGLMTYAFAYVRDKGITDQQSYPYVARDQTCKTQGGSYKISGFTNVPAGNCNAQSQFLTKQPVSVAVDASNWSLYRGGIFSNCGTRLNHGVLLVADTNDVWSIKNSWGNTWGETGFIRLKSGNTCGVCAMSTVPNK